MRGLLRARARIVGGLAPVLGGVAALAAASWLLAWSLLGAHFPGFLVTRGGHVDALLLREWPGQAAQIMPYSQVLAVDGRPVRGGGEVFAYVATRPVGTPVRYRLRSPLGEAREVAVPVAAFSRQDLLRVFEQFWWSGLAHVALGTALLLARPGLAAAWAHAWLCLTLGAFMLVNFDGCSTHAFPVWLVPMVTAAIAPSVVALALLFPTHELDRRGRRRVVGVLLALAALITLVAASGGGLAFAWANWGALLLAAVAVFAATARWLWAALGPASAPEIRAQARPVAIGVAIAFIPALLTTVLVPALGSSTPGLGVAESAWIAFPLSVAYAILRHGAFDFRPALRSLLLYIGATALLAGLYFGLVAAGAALGGGEGPGVAAFAAALAVAIAFRPLHDALKRALDRLFLGDQLDALAVLERFVQRPELGSAALAADLVALVRRQLRPTWVAVWVGPERLAAEGPAPATAPEGPAADVAACWSLDAEARAVLALGPRETGIAYTPSEQSTLGLLAAHAATALRSARLQEERVAAMLNERLARALAEERAKLIQQLVHDLRTDIFNISLAAELGRRSPEAVEEAFSGIERSATRLDAFLREKVALVKAGRLAPRTSLVDPLAAVELVMAPMLALRKQALVLEVAEAEVPLSGIELGQVALNLLTNASKASPEGARLRCEARREDGWLTLAVTDAGPGLPQGFSLAGQTREGGGLGLLNVAALVAEAGGTLAWRNAPVGAVFEARLPLIEGASPAASGSMRGAPSQ